jgi:hypothetical protein
VNRSIPPTANGTSFGTPVEPEVVSMKALSSLCTSASWSPVVASSRSAAVTTVPAPARSNSSVSVSSGSVGDGRTTVRPARRQPRTNAIACGDFFAHTPTGPGASPATLPAAARIASASSP